MKSLIITCYLLIFSGLLSAQDKGKALSEESILNIKIAAGCLILSFVFGISLQAFDYMEDKPKRNLYKRLFGAITFILLSADSVILVITLKMNHYNPLGLPLITLLAMLFLTLGYIFFLKNMKHPPSETI